MQSSIPNVAALVDTATEWGIRPTNLSRIPHRPSPPRDLRGLLYTATRTRYNPSVHRYERSARTRLGESPAIPVRLPCRARLATLQKLAGLEVMITSPWLNWIARRPPEPKVTGSNPVGDIY